MIDQSNIRNVFGIYIASFILVFSYNSWNWHRNANENKNNEQQDNETNDNVTSDLSKRSREKVLTKPQMKQIENYEKKDQNPTFSSSIQNSTLAPQRYPWEPEPQTTKLKTGTNESEEILDFMKSMTFAQGMCTVNNGSLRAPACPCCR